MICMPVSLGVSRVRRFCSTIISVDRAVAIDVLNWAIKSNREEEEATSELISYGSSIASYE
jgi:hypothetical protein